MQRRKQEVDDFCIDNVVRNFIYICILYSHLRTLNDNNNDDDDDDKDEKLRMTMHHHTLRHIYITNTPTYL